MYEKVPDAGKMSDKEKRDIFMHAVIDAVRGIEVFNYSNRQTTGQDVSYSVLKDYLLQEESSTRREAPKVDKYVRRGCCGDSGQGRGGMREAGTSDTVSGETRTPVVVMAIWLETVPHPGKGCATSAISQDTRRGTVQTEREREKDETKCRRSGRNAQTSLVRVDRGEPLVLLIAAKPVLEAREAGAEEAEVEAAVLSKTGL